MLAALLHLKAHRDGVLQALGYVVGINQQHAVRGEFLGVGAECLQLVVEGHDPGMGMGAGNGKVELASGKHVGGAGAAAHDGRAAGAHAARFALGAAQAELGNRRFGRQAHACRLGGRKRFEVHAVQKLRFQKLALNDGPNDAHDGVVREHNGALAHRIDIHRNLQRAQVLKELGAEQLAAARGIDGGQVADALVGKREVLQHLGDMVHATGYGIAALEGGFAEEDVEASLFLQLAARPIALRHGYLVQVG